MAKPKYRVVGFGGDGPELWKEVTSDEAQLIAENNNLYGYLLHPPWRAYRKKRDNERTYRYGKTTDKPYKQTTCRRLMFRVLLLLSHKEKHVPDWEEIDNR